MSKIYNINYTETYEGTFSVRANSEEEALAALEDDRYADVLDDVQCIGSTRTLDSVEEDNPSVRVDIDASYSEDIESTDDMEIIDVNAEIIE